MKTILSDRPLSLPTELLDADCQLFDVSALKINRCVGCFGCWVKTPGQCVIRDDAVKVYPCLAKSGRVIYVSRICYGGYDVPMKTMLERAIPVQMAFIRLVDGETHHVQRAVVPKQALIVAYGADTKEEQEVFRRLVARNAKNMGFAQYEIRFVPDEQVEETVRKELAAWKKS
ncbi:MAG TPA: flavodoxin family protein [Firmicutes bacterium]|nr:flavodoxin family protein [Bacillota bacterium]